MDKRIHQVRLAEWSQRIIDRKNSGLTIAQWCELNGFTKDTYHYWQKRVRTAVLESAGAAGMVWVPVFLPTVTHWMTLLA